MGGLFWAWIEARAMECTRLGCNFFLWVKLCSNLVVFCGSNAPRTFRS